MILGTSIAILATRRKNGRGLEFRVARFQTLENLYHKPDYPQMQDAVINRAALLEIFQSSPTFYTARRAECHVRLIEIKIVSECFAIGTARCDLHRIDLGKYQFPVTDKQLRRQLQKRKLRAKAKRKKLQHEKSFYRHLRWPKEDIATS
jgi:hypothetical protein